MPILRRRDRSDLIISSNSSIGHNSVPEKRFIDIANVQNGISQVRVNDVSISQPSTSQVSFSQIDFSKTSSSQVSSSQIDSLYRSSRHVGFPQISLSQIDIFQTPVLKPPFTQIAETKVNSNNIHVPNNSLAEIDTFKNGKPQSFFGIVAQVHPSKITFSSSVSPEQFFKGHLNNSTPQIINNLNNTATKIWSDLLQTETQLDINFQITDLPTEQLAEATITDFDKNEVPNARTILIDHDANGVGWVIDETPWDFG